MTVQDAAIVLEQTGQYGRKVSSLRLSPQGDLLISLPVEKEGQHGLSVVLAETVQKRLAAALRYAAWMLDHVDPIHRLSHVVVAAQLTGGLALRTQREHDASPNSMQMSSNFGGEHPPVHLTPAHMSRAALSQQADQLVEDLVTLVRRQWK